MSIGELAEVLRDAGILREAGGLLVVLNGFNESDLTGQLRRFREELLFADLEIITNRIDKVNELLRKPRSAKQILVSAAS